MDLRHLRYFVAVGEELHFRRAAERVHIAQPALSIQIKALEEYLGGTLILRNNRRVELTEAGRHFLDQARSILRQIDDATRSTRRALRGETGFLRIAYSGNAAETGTLARAVRAFRQRFADVEVSVMEMDPPSQLDALLRGDIQAALMTTLSKTLPPGITVMRLGAWPLRLVLPDNHLLAQKQRIRIDDIRHEPFVVYATHEGDDGTSVFRHVAGFTPVVAHRVTSAIMVTALVGAGLGLGMLPESMEKSALQAGSVLRPIAGIETAMDVSLATLEATPDPVTRQFISTTKATFALG
ncbi:LysR family transcriptional regulator [Brenneria tiliae]|uniref:LysR substrate-binding domain-containing protein n=1 Tax=Brenneria tiliae TaxID=2914984 RepID=A0ABT0MYV9_9GAMM|nr:LysR substrate-binding domain-containing protein [Brenneria tiliae]MCL2895043.1 LysR substrate-binding domain-containing protein [Brenneria tiliae]